MSTKRLHPLTLLREEWKSTSSSVPRVAVITAFAGNLNLAFTSAPQTMSGRVFSASGATIMRQSCATLGLEAVALNSLLE